MSRTLYYNGRVIAMTSPQDVHEALVEEGGRILAVGSEEKMRAAAGAGAQTVDLAGGALLPGFIDGHSHIAQFAGSLRCVMLGGCRSIADLTQALRRYIDASRPAAGAWVIGFGYDHNALAEGRHPDRAALDAVSAAHPIVISHASGHMGVLNSAALAALGITADTPDPAGGRIGRQAGTREPNGYLEETAFVEASGRIPQPTTEELVALLARAQKIYAGYGITTAQEGLLKAPEFAALDAAARAQSLRLDVVAYADIRDNARLVADNPQYARYSGRLRIGGYKLFLDGSPQGRTAWLTQPYLPQPGQPDEYCGYPVYADEQVRAYVAQAEKDGQQLLVHCNGDAAIDQLLGAFDAPTVHRDVVIHAQLMRRDQLPQVKALGLMPSYFVAHTYYWGDVHLLNLGEARAREISPLRSTEKLEIPFTLHQDTPVLPPDMLDTIGCAMERRTKNGVQLDPAESVSAYEALCAVTKYAAYQYFEEGSKGTLEPGKRADLVWLDRDPLPLSGAEIKKIRVLGTFKDGRPLNG